MLRSAALALEIETGHEHPTAEWTLQQLREALPEDQEYKFLLHDRHKNFSTGLDEEVERWGIAVLKSPAHAPTANTFCERVIQADDDHKPVFRNRRVIASQYSAVYITSIDGLMPRNLVANASGYANFNNSCASQR